MPYNPPYTPAPQPGPPGNMKDWTPDPYQDLAHLHDDPTANAQLNHLASAGVPPELIKALMDRATGPDPQMPQPPPRKKLSSWEAVAAALHPQLLQQFTHDPTEDPQFRAQMAAFQQAMTNKRSAEERLTQIGNTQSRTGTQMDIANLRNDTTSAQNDIMDKIRLLGLAIQQQNANTRANPPAKPGKLQLHDTPTGPMWFDPENPNAVAIPAKGPQGDIGPKVDPKVQAQMNSLQEALGYIQDMRQKYRNVVKGSSMGAIGRGAKAELLAVPSWAGGGMTRAAVGYADPDARQHEADRQALVFMMQKAETDQNRVLQSVIQQVLQQIPSISEAPAVAEPMYDKLEGIAKNALSTYSALPQARPELVPSGSKRANTGSNPTLDRARAIADWIKGGKQGPRP